MADLVRAEQAEFGATILTLSDPSRYNALSEPMIRALMAALAQADEHAAARSVVIAAEGKAFCAGHDLKEMLAHNSLAEHQALFALCSKLMQQITNLSVPVIAEVQGIATAAGCQLVAQCDLAVASSEARFAVSGVNLGLFCAAPGVALSRNVGRKAAMEMLLTGEFISAEEAKHQGLVNRVVGSQDLRAETMKLCAAIAKKPRLPIQMGKTLFCKQLEMGSAAAYQLAAQTMACNMMDASAQEGVGAFVEKRAPNW